jgi:hypothetical protein
MQKAIFILFLSFIVLPVFSQDIDQELRSTDLYKDGFIQKKNFESTISFEIVDEWIALKPLINGVEVKLLFDTHAGLTTLSTKFVKQISLHKKGWNSVKDGKGELKKTDIFKIDSIKIGDLVCEGTSCVTTNLPSFMVDLGFNGILGADIINRFNWQINFDTKKITITDKQVEKQTTEEEFYFYMKNNVPYVTLKLDEKSYEYALLDFGCTGSVLLPFQYHSILNEKIAQGDCTKRTKLANGLFGYGEMDTLYYVKANNFSIGEVKLPEIYAEVSKNDNLLIIGMDVFSKFNIVIDNNNYRYLLTRRREKE